MPYRLRGKRIEVKRPQGWRTLKTHRTLQAAKRHLKALKANVKH
jgi:hypothetical protein